MNKYIVGIDNGGTMAKAVVFDIEGKQISSASGKVELLTPHPGYTERDMDVLWSENAKIIKEAIDNANLNQMILLVFHFVDTEMDYTFGKKMTNQTTMA